MSAPQDDAAIVAAMVRDFDFPRYTASLFVSPQRRRSLLALAAFDLEIRRIADQVTQPLPGEVRLQWWVDAIKGTEHGGVAGHPIAAELLRAMSAEAWSREALSRAIEAHTFDLYGDPMPTLAALEVYCNDTTGSLIGLAADRSTEVEAVRHAGRAIGLARIVAHLAHDASHGRCFLPQDLLAACGINRAHVLAGEDSSQLREARSELLKAARNSLLRAKAGIKLLPRENRVAFLPLASLDAELRTLEGIPSLAVPPPPSRLRVLTSQWWMAR